MPKFQGAIFDVDGVLVNSPHEKAWRESLRELMESGWRDIRDQTTWLPDAFTSHVRRSGVHDHGYPARRVSAGTRHRPPVKERAQAPDASSLSDP